MAQVTQAIQDELEVLVLGQQAEHHQMHEGRDQSGNQDGGVQRRMLHGVPSSGLAAASAGSAGLLVKYASIAAAVSSQVGWAAQVRRAASPTSANRGRSSMNSWIRRAKVETSPGEIK